MESFLLVEGEPTSRVFLPGLKITMPATKQDLGTELGRLIFRLRLAFLSGSPHRFEGGRVASMMERANTILEENPDIVVQTDI